MDVTLIALLLAQAAPQQNCAPTGMIERRIFDQYGESIVGAGVTAGGILFTLANPETGTFTVLLRRPDGQTCVMIGGTGFTTAEPDKPGKNT